MDPGSLSERALKRLPAITQPQLEHIERLANDVGFLNKQQRNAWISEQVGREIKYLDELRKIEAQELISILVLMREHQKRR